MQSGCVKHLNPRQGITTMLHSRNRCRRQNFESVKHLNPRQGITTRAVNACQTQRLCWGVKHLNPRQGITTDSLYNL